MIHAVVVMYDLHYYFVFLSNVNSFIKAVAGLHARCIKPNALALIDWAELSPIIWS